jgi:hypothetical protein
MKLNKCELQREWVEDKIKAVYSQDLVLEADDGVTIKMNFLGDVMIHLQADQSFEDVNFFDGDIEVKSIAVGNKELSLPHNHKQGSRIGKIMTRAISVSDDSEVSIKSPEFTGRIKIDYEFTEGIQKEIKSVLDDYLRPMLRNERAVPQLTL